MLPSSKEVTVLDILSGNGELYGLQLVDASEGVLKRGTVYVTLSRMERKGYVESRRDDAAAQGPPRRVYRITALGRRALRVWRTVHKALRAEQAT